MTNGAITTNGGNVILGGGADPAADAAIGTADYGMELNNGDIIAGAGNISIRGRARRRAQVITAYISIPAPRCRPPVATLPSSARAGTGVQWDFGIKLDASTITTADGDITLTGIGGNGAAGENVGVVLVASPVISSTGTGAGAGNITLTGHGARWHLLERWRGNL